jgi:N-acetylmuramoyl-L-alanine amidase
MGACIPFAGLVALPAAQASEDSYPGYEARNLALYNAASSAARPAFLAPPGDFSFFALLAAPPAPLTEDAFARAQSVLAHLGESAESESQAPLRSLSEFLSRQQNLPGFNSVLSVLDPTGTFHRFSQAPASEDSEAHGDAFLDAFQDADAKQVPDFSLPLAASAPELPTDPESFHQRLLRARSNPASRPLAGLRIALDPGHMGGTFWDRETGKLVHDQQGHIISEGVINLQVTLLLEQAFKALGAQVLLTHRTLAPVTAVDFAKMDLRPYALDYLRDETLLPWFQEVLAAGPAGSSALFAAADQNASIKKTLAASDVNRDEYFILGEDLMARSKAINDFEADIALVIHFDTSSPPGDPWGVNTGHRDGTKAYVVGSFQAQELSSRTERAYFARHALDAASWNASLALGRSVVSQLHTELKLSFDQGGGGVSRQLEPGIFSRNLGVSRRVTGRALTYVECLFYNDPTEFAELLDAHHPMQIGSESRPYSDRLAQVAQAIQKGVLSFVSHYGD